ncbi:MAG: DoxX family protein [Verrucomicrobiota bacterium JB023]|nr:DoxX family protein [Verrucomicrobiota bacterium JB023]
MIKKLSNLTNEQLAYHCARLAMGVSLFTHGAVRVPKITQFVSGMAKGYEGTLIGGFPAHAAGYLIVLLEVAVGLSLLIGGRVIRWGLAAGIILMGILMFGTCLIEKWANLPSQIVHLIIFYLLLINRQTRDKN